MRNVYGQRYLKKALGSEGGEGVKSTWNNFDLGTYYNFGPLGLNNWGV